LIVDDDTVIADGLARAVRRFGYAVHIANDITTALAVIRSETIGVAILDINLGADCTSAEAARELAKRNIPVLFLTGLEQPELPELPASAVVAFLTKPANYSALGTTLELLRKQARTQRELEDTLRMLAESQRIASMGSFQLDYVTGELRWTDETYRVFGVTKETFTPHRDSFLAMVHPDDREVIAAGMQVQDVPPGIHEVEYSIVRPDGEVRRIRGASEHTSSSSRTSVMGTVQDITERAAMERRARMAHDANRAKTEFLAHMSHELRTPLNAVLGLSEAMIERAFGDLNAEQLQTLETIHKSGRHLLELINDVLDIARVESGKLAVDLEQTALRPLVDEATSLMANILATRDQRLIIELAPALPPVELDKRRMRQVLINLLGNASKFSPRGSAITLRVTADSARREIAMSVSDHGPGIPPEYLIRIFEPFVSVNPLLTRAHDGAGLGLALAKRIVELHGGRLLVDSEIGSGSTFTVVLSVAPAYVEPPARPILVRPPTRPGTVLLVEDNEATVLAVKTYLESRGFGIRVVSDGYAALAAAAEQDVVLVLMDIQLPGIDGIEVTRRLRANAFEKPIVALTAYAMPQDERRCLDAGASAYMSKPVRLRSLAATIDRLLEVE